jgi:hypothetical protein
MIILLLALEYPYFLNRTAIRKWTNNIERKKRQGWSREYDHQPSINLNRRIS